MSSIAHLLPDFRGNPSPRSGPCISRVIGVMAVRRLWLHSPVYCGRNINAFCRDRSKGSSHQQPLIRGHSAPRRPQGSFAQFCSFSVLSSRHDDRRPTSGQGSVLKRTSNRQHSSTMTMLRTRYPASDEITGADASTLRSIGKQWHHLLQQSLQRVPSYRHPFLSMLPTQAQ